MIPNLTGFEWTAIASGALTVLLLAGGFVLGPAAENLGAHLYKAEKLRVDPADEDRWAEYRRTLLEHPGKPGVLPPAQVPATSRRVDQIVARMRRPLDRLGARNERILRERQERRG